MNAVMPDGWIRRFRHTDTPRARLVCLPHAGGSASAYRSWRDALPVDIDLLAVQYPGREDRYAEPCLFDMHRLADAVADAIVPYADRPILLFGHSMGASVAYEVALRMERAGHPPRRVFVSAHPPPHRQRDSALHRLGDEALVADVRRLADDGATLLDEPEVRALFLPMLRADYRLIETYRPDACPPLQTPIDVLLPIDDGEVTHDEALAWQDLCRPPVTLHEVSGGHFYLQRDPADTIRRLSPYFDPR